jgi:hypothetical protein
LYIITIAKDISNKVIKSYYCHSFEAEVLVDQGSETSVYSEWKVYLCGFPLGAVVDKDTLKT